MTSTAAAENLLPAARGLAFLGFPLHPPGQPGTNRADHLDQVSLPMLFLQGTRDQFRPARSPPAGMPESWTTSHASYRGGRGSFVRPAKAERRDAGGRVCRAERYAGQLGTVLRCSRGARVTDQPSGQQLKAIEAAPGPVLVIAGPGAGKTFCLIYRIQHLIQKLGVPPRRILAVTFTNKAAEEIATRLHSTRGLTVEDISRGTLHAICLRILRDFAERCGLRPGFGVADREYQERILRRLRIPSKRCAQALALFSLAPAAGLTSSASGA